MALFSHRARERLIGKSSCLHSWCFSVYCSVGQLDSVGQLICWRCSSSNSFWSCSVCPMMSVRHRRGAGWQIQALQSLFWRMEIVLSWSLSTSHLSPHAVVFRTWNPTLTLKTRTPVAPANSAYRFLCRRVRRRRSKTSSCLYPRATSLSFSSSDSALHSSKFSSGTVPLFSLFGLASRAWLPPMFLQTTQTPC